MDSLPKDPFMLVSYINQQLRDNDNSLDELCRRLDIDKTLLTGQLKNSGFEYYKKINRFW